MSLQISDFFGSYPEIDPRVPTNQSTFNQEITSKEEFRELSPSVSEPPPKRGGAYRHQKLNVRYITWYDRLLLHHDPGTGKSCIITHSAELFKNEYLKDPEDPTKIRGAIILVNGPPTEQNIKNEIVCKCTDRVYETELVMQANSEKVMRGNITRELGKWYEIMTYHAFATVINNFEREEDLDEYMSNKIVYVDEAHNVPTEQDIKNPPNISMTISAAREATAEEVQKINRKNAKRVERGLAPLPVPKYVRGESIYQTIYRAFHRGKRNKIVLATATPMINTPNDIIPVMNLLLPLDFQIPFFADTLEEQKRFSEMGLDFFEPYFRGRVSYIRAFETGAVERSMGEQPDGYYTKIFPCDMSGFQYGIYMQASQNPEAQRNQNQRQDFYFNQRQISNFVFPDGSYGTEGFSRYVEKVSDAQGPTYQFRPDVLDGNGRTVQEYIQTEQGFRALSEKYWTIFNLCRESFPDTEIVTDDTKGIIFIYFPDFVHGSGAVLLGLCLKQLGYEEFRSTRSIFVGTENAGYRTFGPCTSTAEAEIAREAVIPKRPRFAILSSDTPKAQIPTIFNTLNSYENRYGQYLQVLIGSQTSREGININNAVKMMMASSSWNYSNNFQAHDRVFRATSHVIRIKEKRARLAAAGLPTDNVTFEVQTFNMASVYQAIPPPDETIARAEAQAQAAADATGRGHMRKSLYKDDNNTVDLHLYLLAEEKDRLIRKVTRYLKQSAFDCAINHHRNVRSTDRDLSPICDYMECDYACAGMSGPLLPLDRSTKILYYSDEEVKAAQDEITKIFSKYYSLRIDQIYQLIPNIDKIYVNKAIERMIRQNLQLTDRIGMFSYLRESESGVIYLEKDPFEVRPKPEGTAYTSVLIGTQDPTNDSFTDYVTNLEMNAEQDILFRLRDLSPDSDEFIQLLDSLSIVSKVNLLESILFERSRTGMTNPFFDAIISSFNHAIYRTKEPIDALSKVKVMLDYRGKTRGRKPKPDAQPKIKKTDLPLPDFDPMAQGANVIIHTLLNQETHDRTNYGAVQRFQKGEGQIRIFKEGEASWRNVNNYEYIVYNNIIQKQNTAIRGYYEQFPIYGIMLPPKNEFHIRDRESEGPGVTRDARNVYNGRVCRTWQKPALVDIMYRLGAHFTQILSQLKLALPPAPSASVTREQMVRFINEKIQGRGGVESFPDDKLKFFYSWYQANYSRDNICELIRRYFEASGRLFTGKIPSSLGGPSPPIGSIQVAPPLVEPDYSQPFAAPFLGAIPQLPGDVIPQFAASAGQPYSLNPIPLIPTAGIYEIPQTQTSFTQPIDLPPVANAFQPLSSNVGPNQAMRRY